MHHSTIQSLLEHQLQNHFREPISIHSHMYRHGKSCCTGQCTLHVTAMYDISLLTVQNSDHHGASSGPERMVRTGCLTAWSLNNKRNGGAYLNVHRATWQL